ncbi:MAG: GGDEF domain-containing protein [Bacillota bacterium]
MLRPFVLSSDAIGLVSDMLLEGALLTWVGVSIYMSTRFLRDRGMIILLVAGLISFVVGAIGNIYDHIHPVGLWQHVFFVDFAHCGGYIFLSSSVGYLVVRYMRLHEALEREALTDSLTGLYNRRHFYQRLEEAIARYQRYGEPFGVAVLDVDELKEVNDRYGHLKGDEVLREIAQALSSVVRATDSVARFGGDEFVVLFSGAANEEGVIDRLLKEMGKCSKTASIGVSFCPRDGTTGDELVALADRRMYEDKAKKDPQKNNKEQL